MRGEFDHFARIATLIDLSARLHGRCPGAKSDDQSAQRTPLVDGKKLAVDEQLRSRGHGAAAYALDNKSQLAQTIGNFFGESIFHLASELPLAFRRILHRWLLAHDSLVLCDFALAHGKVINEDSRRPR